jgi:hypothetical protein
MKKANQPMKNKSEKKQKMTPEILGWKNKWKCAVDMAARAQLESEFWKNRSINFEATLRTIRFIAVDSDIKQIASEALDKSHDQ